MHLQCSTYICNLMWHSLGAKYAQIKRQPCVKAGCRLWADVESVLQILGMRVWKPAVMALLAVNTALAMTQVSL